MNQPIRPTLLLAACAALISIPCVASASKEPSAYERTKDATARGAKASNDWIAHAAKKTDKALDHAFDVVTRDTGAAKAPARPGPRP